MALARADGHEVWRQTLGCEGSDSLDAMSVIEGGDIVVAGRAPGCGGVSSGYYERPLIIARLSGDTGTQVWQRRYDGEQPPGTFSANALTQTTGGDIVAAGGAVLTEYRGISTASFIVLGFSSTNGELRVCGDGYVDSGEACDDGNTSDGDCCSGTCSSAAPDGTACDDGNRCTTEDACHQGTCVGGAPLPCEPCGTCSPLTGCNTELPFQCRTPTASDKAVVRFDNGRSSRHDALFWEWSSGAATTKTEFGDPRTTTPYALCVYGEDASYESSVLLRAAVPAGCSRKVGCWRATVRGFDYRSPSGIPDGLLRLSLKAGSAGRARIAIEGRGLHLGLPALPLTSPVTVQLRRLDGQPPCWSAEHALVAVNRTHRFVARGN
jgi:cysteine-rich repeat protein